MPRLFNYVRNGEKRVNEESKYGLMPTTFNYQLESFLSILICSVPFPLLYQRPSCFSSQCSVYLHSGLQFPLLKITSLDLFFACHLLILDDLISFSILLIVLLALFCCIHFLCYAFFVWCRYFLTFLISDVFKTLPIK